MTRGPLERKTMKEEVDTKTCERLFVLSANDKATAEKVMQNLGIYLEQRPEVFQNDLLGNLAYTLGQRKSFHPWRVALTASSGAALVEALSSGKIIPCKQDMDPLRIGWIFTGQGAQWWAMGRELCQTYPIYSSALRAADAHLISIGATFSLLTELEKGEHSTQVNAAYLSQPACTAVQLALVDLFRSWGIHPVAVVGHSSGEIGAAYAAGFITFNDAMTIAYHRGRLVPILKEKYPALEGCMMAVGAGKREIAPLLDQIPSPLGQARIACINSPSSVTISGDEPAVTMLHSLIEERYPGMFARRLQIDTAYHSHHMDLVAKEYTEALRELQLPVPSGVRFYSSLLGRLATSEELDASYWVQNLTCAVRFDEAVQSMCRPMPESNTGINFLCELGPHAALQGPIKQILKHVGGAASKISYTSALSRKQDAVRTTLAMAGALFVKGAELDLGSINFPTPLQRSPQVLVDMPRYPWNHTSKYYHESRITKVHKFHKAPRHDIIGVFASYSSDLEPAWSNVIRLDDLPWLRQYQMQGVTIFPISGFLAMAIEAGVQRACLAEEVWESIEIKDLSVKTPAMLTEEQLEMTITLRQSQDEPGVDSSYVFNIRSWSPTKGWSEHCTGSITLIQTNTNEVDGQRSQKYKRQTLYSQRVDITQAATECISTDHMYAQLSEAGVAYGPLFQGLARCHTSARGSVAQIVRTDTASEMPHHHETTYVMHPASIEQLVSMYWPVLSATGPLSMVHLPASIGKFTIFARAIEKLQVVGDTMQAVCVPNRTVVETRPNSFTMSAVDAYGEPIIIMEDLLTSPIVEMRTDSQSDEPQELCYKLEWEPICVPQDMLIGTSPGPSFDTEVVIIHGETESQHNITSALTKHLISNCSAKVSQGTIESIAHSTQNKICLVLTELDRALLATLSSTQFEALQAILTSVQGIMWVTQGGYYQSRNPDANMVSGLSRTLRSEGTLSKFVTLDFEAGEDLSSSDLVPKISQILRMTLGIHGETKETEFRAKEGKLFTPRIVDDCELNTYVHEQTYPAATEPASLCDTARPLCGSIAVPGVMESLRFQDDDRLQEPLSEDDVDIQIKAIGVRAEDCLSVSKIGTECSGIITAVGSNVPHLRVGDHVVAITIEGSLSTIARVSSDLVCKAPAHVSFESLASMPIAYCTAVYALTNQARLSEGENVLVHDAASPVGQAALAVAISIGATVWATVKTEDEKLFVMHNFSVAQDRVWFAGGTYFAERIKDATQGLGIDVVFNTLTNRRVVHSTWACLAKFGRFVNVAGEQPTSIDMASDTNATFFSANVAALARYRPMVLRRTLSDMARMMRYGQIYPLSRIRSFNASETMGALQYVSTARNTDQAVVLLRDHDYVVVSTSVHSPNNS